MTAGSLDKAIQIAEQRNSVEKVYWLDILNNASVHVFRHVIMRGLIGFLLDDYSREISRKEMLEVLDERQSHLYENLSMVTGEALSNANIHRIDGGLAYVAYGLIDDRFVTVVVNECFYKDGMYCPSFEELNDQLDDHRRGRGLMAHLLNECAEILHYDMESFATFPNENCFGLVKRAWSVRR